MQRRMTDLVNIYIEMGKKKKKERKKKVPGARELIQLPSGGKDYESNFSITQNR